MCAQGGSVSRIEFPWSSSALPTGDSVLLYYWPAVLLFDGAWLRSSMASSAFRVFGLLGTFVVEFISVWFITLVICIYVFRLLC